MRTQLKNRNVDKTLARLLAVLLTVVLALSSLPGCMLFEAGNGPAGPWANNHGQGIVQPDDPDPDPDPDHQPRALDALADDLLDFELAADYTSYHQLVARPADYRFGAGFAAPLPSFGDISYEAMLAQADFYTELLAEVRQHNPARLDPDQLRLYQYLSYSLESSLALVPYFYLEDPYEPSSGTHSDLALTLLTFQFRTTADIDDYLTLAADIPRILKQADDIAVQRSSDGFYPNLTAVESAIEEAEVYAAPPDSNILVASFEDSLASGVYPFSGLSDDQRAGYAAANREIVEQQLIPAYQQTIALLEDIATHTDYQTTLPKLPGAKDYYAAAMRTLGFYESPDQAIARLDEQLDELNDRVISGAGYLDSVKQDRVAERNLPGDAASIIEYYNSCVSEHFPDIGQRPFRVDTASDDEVMKMFSAFYMLAPIDDLTENRIVYYPQNIYSSYSLGLVLGHESFPGHLYQFNQFGLSGAHPVETLLSTTAYAEGYAVYSEYYTMLYMGFSEAEASAMHAYELYVYALYARLDLGVNYQGWGLKETISFLDQWGLASIADDLYQEVASAPLMMLPYGLAPLEFVDLLATAQSQLGNRFDIKEFHGVILEGGGLPLRFLHDNVYDWLGM